MTDEYRFNELENMREELNTLEKEREELLERLTINSDKRELVNATIEFLSKVTRTRSYGEYPDLTR